MIQPIPNSQSVQQKIEQAVIFDTTRNLLNLEVIKLILYKQINK